VRILIDECLPRRLTQRLPGHEASTVAEMGWAGTRNGELLRLAEQL
jgi:predicted nuclease of predicted toxin-antitoxin system